MIGIAALILAFYTGNTAIIVAVAACVALSWWNWWKTMDIIISLEAAVNRLAERGNDQQERTDKVEQKAHRFFKTARRRFGRY